MRIPKKHFFGKLTASCKTFAIENKFENSILKIIIIIYFNFQVTLYIAKKLSKIVIITIKQFK